MQQAFLDINGVPTKVITWGKRIEESSPDKGPQDIIICIPGNPGVSRFYTVFLQTIYEQLGYPIWTLGHAGHEPPLNRKVKGIPALQGNENLYDLQGQVDHKLEFIEKYVPENARIHFIGHSIGSYIILQLLKIPSISSRVVSNYFLFPTIEHMSDTRNGKFLGATKYIIRIILFLAWIFTFLPALFQNLLTRGYMRVRGVQRMHFKTILDFVRPDILEKVFFMGFDEMDKVKKRDTDILVANKSKTKLYYGATDNWTPESYFEQLKKDIPDIDAEICNRDFPHAFVLKHSRDVGIMVANWMKEKK